MTGSSIEEEYVVIRNCRRISRVDIINEEVKRWTSSLQLSNHSASEIEKLNREKNARKKERKLHLSILQIYLFLLIRQPEQVEQ